MQWACFLGAAVAAGGVAVWDFGGLVGRVWEVVEGKRWLEGRGGGEMVGGRCEEEERKGKGEWWMFPGREYVDFGVGGEDENENEMVSRTQSVVLDDREEVDIDTVPVVGSEVEGEEGEDEQSPDSQTPLLTPSDSEESEPTAAKVIDNTVGDQNAQEEAILRDRKGVTRRLLGKVIAGLSRDRLMGLAWLLTVAAWLVMYGRSKKGRFGDWIV